MQPPTGRLLIIEDHAELRNALSELLKECAETIQTASSGAEALKLITSGSFDAILSDIEMPNMSGLDLLFYVRSLNLDTPVVFLTGFADKERRIFEAFRLGAIDLLEKPIEESDVVHVMRKVVRLGVAMNEVRQEVESLCTSKEIPVEQRLRNQKLKTLLTSLNRMNPPYLKQG